MAAWKVCATCPEAIPSGTYCDSCRKTKDRARGTAAQRGYGRSHRRFRRGVLTRDPVCVLCLLEPSVEADHWPLSRRELEQRGMDPNDPRHGRGLCHRCHSSETARNQPGGWNTTT